MQLLHMLGREYMWVYQNVNVGKMQLLYMLGRQHVWFYQKCVNVGKTQLLYMMICWGVSMCGRMSRTLGCQHAWAHLEDCSPDFLIK